MDQDKRGNVKWAYAAMFGVAMTTLALELLCTRVVSATAYYHLTFFVISLAILGMTVGALLVYVLPQHFRPAEALPKYTDLLSISIPIAVAGLFAIPIPTSISLTGLAALGLTALLLSVPFTFSGILVSLTLTRCGLPYGRIYAADLIGAAAGAELVIVGMNFLDPGAFALMLGVCAAICSVCYRLYLRTMQLRGPIAWATTLLLLCLLSMNTETGLVPLYSKGQTINMQTAQFFGWNDHSMVLVEKPHVGQPFLWGPSPNMPSVAVEQSYLSIDGGAGTHLTRFNGDIDSVSWMFNDVSTLAYQIQEPRRSAIIGAGGGRDILAALCGGAEQVVGIDVNSMIIDLLEGNREPTIAKLTGLADHPSVKLVHDDARSYLTTSKCDFDTIQMSLIDTWAASSAGAYALTENGLYTKEAWNTFLDRLSDRGIFTVSRWYQPDGFDETTRIVSMAVSVCLDQGLMPPRDHVALASCGKVATLVISRKPIHGELLKNLHNVCDHYDFSLLIAPDRGAASAQHESLLSATTHDELNQICRASILDITPSTDDRPYFFNQLRLSTLPGFLSRDGDFGGAMGNLQATLTLLVAFGFAIMGVALGICWPLKSVGLPAGLVRESLVASFVYFLGIGLGFMLIEISLVQRFSVLLGHPSYALALVIASMVLASGVGSFFADKIPSHWTLVLRFFPAAIIAFLLVAWILLPSVFAAAVSASFAVRVAATLSFTVPAGLTMGLCFPLGMRLVERFGPSATPWMWGVNGAASVAGTILAVLISMSFGISWTIVAGIACYGAVLIANLWLTRPIVSQARKEVEEIVEQERELMTAGV